MLLPPGQDRWTELLDEPVETHTDVNVQYLTVSHLLRICIWGVHVEEGALSSRVSIGWDKQYSWLK